MEKINDYKGDALDGSPRVPHGTDLNHLIDIATETDDPIVVLDDNGSDIGVIDKSALLKGIQGGRE